MADDVQIRLAEIRWDIRRHEDANLPAAERIAKPTRLIEEMTQLHDAWGKKNSHLAAQMMDGCEACGGDCSTGESCLYHQIQFGDGTVVERLRYVVSNRIRAVA
jgi:hypothetical protein